MWPNLFISFPVDRLEVVRAMVCNYHEIDAHIEDPTKNYIRVEHCAIQTIREWNVQTPGHANKEPTKIIWKHLKSVTQDGCLMFSLLQDDTWRSVPSSPAALNQLPLESSYGIIFSYFFTHFPARRRPGFKNDQIISWLFSSGWILPHAHNVAFHQSQKAEAAPATIEEMFYLAWHMIVKWIFMPGREG